MAWSSYVPAGKPMEDYIAEQSQAEFSHEICPECKPQIA